MNTMKTSTDIQPLVATLLVKLGSGDEGVQAIIDLAVLVAAADGKIDQAEHAALAGSLAEIIGGALAPPVARHLVRESKQKLEADGAEVRAKAIGATLRASDAAGDGLRLALAVAYASEGLSDAERARIEIVAAGAGTPDGLLDELAESMRPA